MRLTSVLWPIVATTIAVRSVDVSRSGSDLVAFQFISGQIFQIDLSEIPLGTQTGGSSNGGAGDGSEPNGNRTGKGRY